MSTRYFCQIEQSLLQSYKLVICAWIFFIKLLVIHTSSYNILNNLIAKFISAFYYVLLEPTISNYISV